MNIYIFTAVFNVVLAAEFGTKAAVRPGVDIVWAILTLTFTVLATLLFQKGLRQERSAW